MPPKYKHFLLIYWHLIERDANLFCTKLWIDVILKTHAVAFQANLKNPVATKAQMLFPNFLGQNISGHLRIL